MKVLKEFRQLKTLLDAGRLDRLVVRKKLRYSRDSFGIIQIAKQQKLKIKYLMTDAFDREYGDCELVGILTEVKSYSLDEIILSEPKWVVVLDHIQDPHNFGAIIRSVESFGAGAVIYPKDRQVPITETVINASSGAIDQIKMCQVTNLAGSLKKLREADFWVYATVADSGASLPEWTPNFPLALIVSNEHKGLSPGLKKMIDDQIQIPTIGVTSSLNVSVATGIVGFYLSR